VLMMAMGNAMVEDEQPKGLEEMPDESNLWVAPASEPPAGFNRNGVAGFDRISGRLHGKAHTDRGI
jgi:hypothetical protein